MRTYLDCIPCFFKQALEAVRITKVGENLQKKVLDELAKAVSKFPLTSSPPEMGKIIYGLVRKITQQQDPYAEIKKRSNKLALGIYSKLKRKVSHAQDRLLMAVELAIAGNIIDYGVNSFSHRKEEAGVKVGGSLDIEAELTRILNQESKLVKRENERIFNYSQFKVELKNANHILYLADNAGETVFDRILLEEIKRIEQDKKITYAVRGGPIINDALLEDAYECGIDQLAEVISSGSDAPGTILSLCSQEFLKIYKKTDMIISKGQGNFEAMSHLSRPVFFLFMAKCPVVAKDVSAICKLPIDKGCKVGDIILLYHGGK